MFLSDESLQDELAKDVIEELGDWQNNYSIGSPVQPASVDLHIGNVYVPEAALGEPGAPNTPKDEHILDPGATAVVTTRESCSLPDDLGAIGFPPTSVSSAGILMTNPGHIDPGYRGILSFTIINMSKDRFVLRRDARIVTLLLFRLTPAAKKGYIARGNPAHTEVSSGFLSKLSADFLNVTDRAEHAARDEEQRARRDANKTALIIAAVTFVGTLLAVTVAIYVPWKTATEDDIRQLQRQVSALEARSGTAGLERRVKHLEAEIARLRKQ